MTTREKTAFMPRSLAKRPSGHWANLAAVISFAPIQAPWLIRSLRGGSKAEKRRLLQRLDLPRDALPNLGSWKADTGLLHLLVDTVEEHRPSRVIEFGIGASSLVLAAALKQAGLPVHRGFDQHRDFIAKTEDWLGEHGLEADFDHAPLVEAPAGWPGLWYDHPPIEPGIDLLVIDGPPWTIHPFTRGAAEQLFDLVAPSGRIILDDGARPGERLIARQWAKLHPDIDFELVKSGTKGTLVGVRR